MFDKRVDPLMKPNTPHFFDPILKLSILGFFSLLYACGGSQPHADAPSKPHDEDHVKTHSANVSKLVRESTRETLVPFDSEAALHKYAQQLAGARRERDAALAKQYDEAADGEPAAGAAPPAPQPAAPVESSAAAPAGAAESITNVQEQGVDEGGIVKTRGNHLVVLRRGRLFSIDVSDEQQRPISMVNVFPPGPRVETWYDEMLISGNTIVVIGYSYGSGGTELGVFNIDDTGRLTRRSTQYLSSDDYYSSRNYASRLLGNQLIFYMPRPLFSYGHEDTLSLPGFRPTRSSQWQDIIHATQVYQPIQPTEDPVLHTVVTCDVGTQLACSARGVIGPYGRNFYVSQSAVYVWVHEGYSDYSEDGEAGHSTKKPLGVVYRLPLGKGEPGALRVAGAPTDQFSFKETDDQLHVLVRSEGGGDWMWSPEVSQGSVALLSVPLASFTTRANAVNKQVYTALPHPGEAYNFQNRFIGNYVVYGTGAGWGYAREESQRKAFFYPYRQGSKATTLTLPHGVDRLEALGQHAVVIGSDGQDLHFTAVDLTRAPKVEGRFTQQAASQGETRSHGFFFKPSGERDGVLGLPIRGGSAPGSEHLMHGSASVLFLGVNDLRFEQLGNLAALARNENDNCVMSCVDWYGNARPIFYRQRVFALLGYELVEGRIQDNKLIELGRTHFLDALTRGRLQRATP